MTVPFISGRISQLGGIKASEAWRTEPRDPHTGEWGNGVGGVARSIKKGGRAEVANGIDPRTGKPVDGTVRGTVVRLTPTHVMINAGSKTQPKWVQAELANAHPMQRAKPRTGVGPGRRGYLERLTKGESDAVDAYKGYGYKRINGQLRAGHPGGITVRQLDSAISRGSLSTDTKLYRSFHASTLLRPGDIISDRAFVSTSSRRDVAERFTRIGGSKRKLVRIHAPAGLPAAFLPGQNEDEVLLGRNSHFLVKRVHDERGVTVLDVDVVN